MSKYGLVIYKFKVTNTNTGKICLPCNAIAPDGRTLVEVVEHELNAIGHKAFDNKYDKKVSLRLDPNAPSNHELFSTATSFVGRINYGFYGDASEIHDENDNHAFSKTTKHTDNFPMFFDMLIKRNSNPSYLIFQTYKNMGIKTLISQFFASKIRRHFQNYLIEILPYWPPEVKSKLFEEDNLHYVKITSRKKLSDKSDLPIIADPDTEIVVEEKISIVRPRKAKKDSIKAKLTTSDPQISDFTEDESVRSVTIGVDENGRDRGIKIGKGLGRAPSFDVVLTLKTMIEIFILISKNLLCRLISSKNNIIYDSE